MSKPIDWTSEQRHAIETTGKSLIVSAAAGSGKTAVLAQRCVELIVTGGTSGEPCSVEELLVVTFTNAAARQMRERIGKRLHEALDVALDARNHELADRLQHEIDLLPRAAIGTLHSFAGQIIRQHFHRLDLDPAVITLDAGEARLLKRRAMRDLFDHAYDGPDAEDFARLVDHYAGGWDDGFESLLRSGYELLTSEVDPATWKRQAIEQLEAAATRPLPDSVLGRAFLDQIKLAAGPIASMATATRRAVEAASDDPKLDKLKTWSLGRCDAANQLMEAIDAGDFIAAAQTLENPGTRPSPRGAIAGLDEIKDAVVPLNDALKSDKLQQLFARDTKQLQTDLAKTIEPARQVLALIDRFDAIYQTLKADARAMDFSDLERFAMRLLDTEVAEQYRRQFRHVLVDEFQDINPLQHALLTRLSRCDDGEPTNQFCVGDVKQSIYRFRLAEPKMFLDALDSLGRWRERINLQQNFRSRPPLLAAINAAFLALLRDTDTVEIDYADDHELIPGSTYEPAGESGFDGAPIEITVLDKAASDGEESAAELERVEREAVYIAHTIDRWRGEGRTVVDEGVVRPMRLGDIAILLRSAQHRATDIARVLRGRDLACQTQIGSGFFESREIIDVLSLLRLLDNARQDIPLAAVLRSPLVTLPNAADVMMRARMSDRDVSFADAVATFAAEDRSLAGAMEQIAVWRERAARQSMADLLWDIFDDTSLLTYVLGLPDGEQRRANLLSLHELAGRFDHQRGQGLAGFIAELDAMESEGELKLPHVPGEGEDAVQIMTIHASKGLEFPIVFLADLGKKHNTQGESGAIVFDRELGVAMDVVDEPREIRYPSLASHVMQAHLHRKSLAEELRVLYVAMTRAKEHLVCVGTVDKFETEASAVAKAASVGEMIAPADVLAAPHPLRWLLLSAVVTPAAFVVSDVAAASMDEQIRGDAVPMAESVVTLGTFDVLSEVPADVRRRLNFVYAHPAATKLPAARGVASLSEADATTHAIDLPRPTCVAGPSRPEAAAIGTATHVLLAKLDWSRAGDVEAVKLQADQLVEGGHIRREEARALDLEAVVWAAASEIGDAIRAAGDEARWEWPVRTTALPRDLPTSLLDELGIDPADVKDSGDRVLVRGVVDLLLPTPGGLWIVDFKTDRPPWKASPQELETWSAAKQERYGVQLDWYGRAMSGATGLPVGRAQLVLLGARQMAEVTANVDNSAEGTEGGAG